MRSVILVVLVLLFTWTACKKLQSYPDTPVVNYKSFSYEDTTLTFSFVDGNGDFGYISKSIPAKDSLDTIANVYLPMEKKINGKWMPVVSRGAWVYPVTDIPLPQGQNKTLKGEIKLVLRDWLINYNFPDTFRFKFWIVDSMRNKSNVDSTPELFKSHFKVNPALF